MSKKRGRDTPLTTSGGDDMDMFDRYGQTAARRSLHQNISIGTASASIAETTRRLQFDHKYMESVLRNLPHSSGDGSGLWFVHDLVSLIAGYAMRFAGSVETIPDGARYDTICLSWGGGALVFGSGDGVIGYRPGLVVSGDDQSQSRVQLTIEIPRAEEIGGCLCAFPHDPNRMLYVTCSSTDVIDLVSDKKTVIAVGGFNPTIHHNPNSPQHAGMMYCIDNGLKRCHFSADEKTGFFLSQSIVVRTVGQSPDWCVFDKSDPHTSLLYFGIAPHRRTLPVSTNKLTSAIHAFDVTAGTVIHDIRSGCPRFTSADCTATGVLLLLAHDLRQIYMFDPRTGVFGAVMGRPYPYQNAGDNTGIEDSEWTAVDGSADAAQFRSIYRRKIVLCGGDRSAFVVDGSSLRFVNLPELDLDQSMFVNTRLIAASK